ncbi:hypothetical protein EO98_19295 [Methanosarcina sp. 2.H.T.1A.6]|nr:hypothetical protein EO94_09895 [Methanosarcina sp. 2.H.T.1A.3]KKG19404.1 hypothetical protein EO98_19295 [Methanosarcina sp. 2.H.T.1A.6]KKG25555.1 hypothetical protein EO96_18550 [Methanosarcina sp. 2.H.T.1A.8]KKG26597.1 hypothetical protein EO97_01785 [Methanosarcina sp. 2.H.T.1A.15]
MIANKNFRFFSEIRDWIVIRPSADVFKKNNIFLVIVFGELFENLQLLSQLKLLEISAGSFQ